MLTFKTRLHDALNRHVEENVNPGLVIAEPGESNLYFLSETVVVRSFLCKKFSRVIGFLSLFHHIRSCLGKKNFLYKRLSYTICFMV